MTWQGIAVRNLRLRLGWSQAEMARRLSLTLEQMAAWEDTEQPPEEDVSHHLDYMSRHVEAHSDLTARKPVADAMMSHFNLSQIHAEQIEEHLETLPELFPVDLK